MRQDTPAFRQLPRQGMGLLICGLVVAVILIACASPFAPRNGHQPTGSATATPPPETFSAATRVDEEEQRFRLLREAMVREQVEARGVEDPAVLTAMLSVPRHEFVPGNVRHQAYQDSPLPIGAGQTISQPYIVGLMTELLQVQPGGRVLEVGTGSAYQAAILAEMGAQVYTIEIIPPLADEARKRLANHGFRDVQTRVGDGYFGWEEEAPFDAIIVTAAPDHVPPPLLAQLEHGGKMVIPVGPPGGVQTLWLIEERNGQWVSSNQGAVLFVPLTRGS